MARRVLIADDSAELGRRLLGLLSELSHVEVVGVACDGDVALQLFEARDPSAAVLDLQMPGTSDPEVVRAIRRTNSTALLIVGSVHDGPQLRTRCLEAGADYFSVNARTSFALPKCSVPRTALIPEYAKVRAPTTSRRLPPILT
jgi:DNA-binding NarL/FixJ family response regulator